MEIFSTIRQIFQSKGETVKLDTRLVKDANGSDGDEDAIDFIDDNSEINALIRYENAFKALIIRGMYTPLKNELTDDDIGKNVQSTVIDSCVHHATKGTVYVTETVDNLDKTILQASLIFTVTAIMYLAPPDFGDDIALDYAFQVISGFTSFTFLLVIILCTSLTATLNMVYSEIDGLVARLTFNTSINVTFLLNYIAILATVTNLILAASNLTSVGVYLQFYGIPICIFAVYQYIFQYSTSARLQDIRIMAFYKQYCDASGALKEKYAEAVRDAKKGRRVVG